ASRRDDACAAVIYKPVNVPRHKLVVNAQVFLKTSGNCGHHALPFHCHDFYPQKIVWSSAFRRYELNDFIPPEGRTPNALSLFQIVDYRSFPAMGVMSRIRLPILTGKTGGRADSGRQESRNSIAAPQILP